MMPTELLQDESAWVVKYREKPEPLQRLLQASGR